jgi:hypothetical protein
VLGVVEDEVSVKSTAGGRMDDRAGRVVRAAGCRDVAAVPVTAGGIARADHSGARSGPGPVTAGGRGALRAGEPAHETLHGEKKKERKPPACCARVERTWVGQG